MAIKRQNLKPPVVVIESAEDIDAYGRLILGQEHGAEYIVFEAKAPPSDLGEDTKAFFQDSEDDRLPMVDC